ncbi:hypothetical protein ACSSS7_005761 [Eimeria intestinalis]
MPAADSMGNDEGSAAHLNFGVLNGNGAAEDLQRPQERSRSAGRQLGATQTPSSRGSEVEELRDCRESSASPNTSLYSPSRLEVEALAKGLHEVAPEASSAISQQRPSLEVSSIEKDSNRRFQKCFHRAGAWLSACTDRILVLLWRVFTFKARHPIATAVGVLAPRQQGYLALLAHLQGSAEEKVTPPLRMSFVPSNASRDAFLDCNFGAYENLTTKSTPDSSPCLFPTSLMPSFGRHYDGLRLMYLPALLHYGGYLAFVDKSGSDCACGVSQPRSFTNDTIKNRVRFYSSYDSMTYFGGSPYLLEADVIGTPAEGGAYGHLTGGFLDLLTLTHAFNLDRTAIRKVPKDPVAEASRKLQPQWRHISELFYKTFDYFGRIPVLDSVGESSSADHQMQLASDSQAANHYCIWNMRTELILFLPFCLLLCGSVHVPAFSEASKEVVMVLVGEAERHLAEILALVACLSGSLSQSSTANRALIAALRIPMWLLGPGIMIIQLYTQQAVQSGCNSEAPAMQMLERASQHTLRTTAEESSKRKFARGEGRK